LIESLNCTSRTSNYTISSEDHYKFFASKLLNRRCGETAKSADGPVRDTSPTLSTVGEKLVKRPGPGYFRGRTESFMAFPTRNFNVVFAGIWIVSPVAGFRPSRAFLSDLTSFPKPGSTNSPFDLTSLVARVARS